MKDSLAAPRNKTGHAWGRIAGGILLALLAAAAILVATHWPFRRAKIIEALEKEADGRKVEIRNFRETFFPVPGCIAEGVVVHRHDASAPPLIEIPKLVVEGDYPSLLTFSKVVQRVRTEGAKILVPARSEGGGRAGTQPSGNTASGTVRVGEMDFDNTLLAFEPKERGKQPFTLSVHHLSLAPVENGRQLRFRTSLHIPEPPGEVTAAGRFGPWNKDDPFQTPASGSYHFDAAKLGVFEGISGVLSSQGKFAGVISRLDVQGATDVPDFEVTSARHPVHLKTEFHAIVNGETGDVKLEPVNATWARTTVISSGAIASQSPEEGKTAALDLLVPQGRIQDLLHLILHARTPGMTGAVSLRGRAVLPPENRKFLEKLRLDLTFGLGAARFTSPATQEGIDKISARAQGDKEEDPASVVSDLKGHITVRDGVARLSDISMSVPGATAYLHGTYNLLSERIDIHGTMRLSVKLSETQKGVKSFLLKALDPFFKRKHGQPGSVVPVKITGTYDNPNVGLDLGHKG